MTRRSLLALLACSAGRAYGQGISSRGVKPQPRGKPSGRPFLARFTDVAAQAEEPKTGPARALYISDPEVAVWWATPVECASAIARLERDGALSAASAAESFKRLDALSRSWIEVEPREEIRETARRLIRVHPLRVADALQLAAALIAAERRPPTLAFVTLDDRLRKAAGKEGFVPADR